MPIPRRRFLGALAVPLLGAQPDPWQNMGDILKRIQPPTFPARDFPITTFGVASSGQTDCTAAFQSAIAACATAGGGRVVVPEGTFLNGPIHLKSNVNLHLAKASVVQFTKDPAKYLPLVFTRREGMECMNYSPFVHADRQQNIAITGSPITLTGGRGRAAPNVATKKTIRNRRRRARSWRTWSRTTCPWISSSLARAATCALSLSSRAAAKTS